MSRGVGDPGDGVKRSPERGESDIYLKQHDSKMHGRVIEGIQSREILSTLHFVALRVLANSPVQKKIE